MPLSKIDAEIASIANKPRTDRPVDTEGLADLREAKRRITGGACGR